MRTNNRNLRRMTQAFVAFLTLGSLLGVTAGPAMAEDPPLDPSETWDITVTVTDSSDPLTDGDPCNDGNTPADWSPDTGMVSFVNSDSIDLFEDDPIVGFSVFLNFSPEVDSCDAFFADPTGTVTATFTTLDPLVSAIFDCSAGCAPASLFGYDGVPGPPGSGQINGDLDFTNATEGTYTSTLEVTWVLGG